MVLAVEAVFHRGDEVDQEGHFTHAAERRDKDAQVQQPDSNTTPHNLPKSGHHETAEHTQHEAQAVSKMKCPTRRTTAELHQLHTKEDEQTEDGQRSQDGR